MGRWYSRSQPVERGAHIVHLAMAVVVRALAQAGAAKIEAQHRQPIAVEGLHGVIDHFVVHGSAEERVRMAHQGSVGGIVPPSDLAALRSGLPARADRPRCAAREVFMRPYPKGFRTRRLSYAEQR